MAELIGVGDIGASGETVTLDSRGYASAVVSVSGAFVGDLEFFGTNGNGAAEGARALAQSGVGPIGGNVVSLSDGADREYRVTAGGETLSVRGLNWVSGTARIDITPTAAASVVEVTGPVHSPVEHALRRGRSFVGGLGPTEAAGTDTAHVVLENPVGSGVRLFLYNRKFSNNNGTNDTNIVYRAFAMPTVDVSGWTTSQGVNLKFFEASSKAMFHTFLGPAEVMGGIEGPGEILPNGKPYDRVLLTEMTEGASIGFTIAGAGGGGNASLISLVLEIYEEPI